MLYYKTYSHKKSKKWVTFVHGAGGNSSIWFRQIRDFKKHFNILLIDLRGHGKSKPVLTGIYNKKYSFDVITDDIIEVLNHLNIKQSHFVGISLGTILIRNVAEKKPSLVKSMILGGATLELNFKSQFLIKFGNFFKSVIPYMFLYKLFAFIIMPKKNHKKSRLLFIEEAKKLCQKEFLKWYKLTSELNPLLRFFRTNEIKIPTLYIMGEQDHLFLPSIKKLTKKHLNSSLHIIKNCGHVVNIDSPNIFNKTTINFINQQVITRNA